jgi:hypothetical protein
MDTVFRVNITVRPKGKRIVQLSTLANIYRGVGLKLQHLERTGLLPEWTIPENPFHLSFGIQKVRVRLGYYIVRNFSPPEI